MIIGRVRRPGDGPTPMIPTNSDDQARAVGGNATLRPQTVMALARATHRTIVLPKSPGIATTTPSPSRTVAGSNPTTASRMVAGSDPTTASPAVGSSSPARVKLRQRLRRRATVALVAMGLIVPAGSLVGSVVDAKGPVHDDLTGLFVTVAGAEAVSIAGWGSKVLLESRDDEREPRS